MRSKRQRELHRAIMRRSRERRRAGRMYVGSTLTRPMIDLLTRCELLPEGDTMRALWPRQSLGCSTL